MSGRAIVVPGQRICKLDEQHKSGDGTYVRNGFIYSSLAGFVHSTEKDDKKIVMEVQTEENQSIVPSVGCIVTGRITNVNPRFCKCAILSVENTALREPFRGMIRKEDVRATEKDKVEMHKSFRPGDIILARVQSLGDAMSYVLTTAENELGVVVAVSEADATMIPISWNQMQCPKSHVKEFRKVARVQPEFITLSKEEAR